MRFFSFLLLLLIAAAPVSGLAWEIRVRSAEKPLVPAKIENSRAADLFSASELWGFGKLKETGSPEVYAKNLIRRELQSEPAFAEEVVSLVRSYSQLTEAEQARVRANYFFFSEKDKLEMRFAFFPERIRKRLPRALVGEAVDHMARLPQNQRRLPYKAFGSQMELHAFLSSHGLTSAQREAFLRESYPVGQEIWLMFPSSLERQIPPAMMKEMQALESWITPAGRNLEATLHILPNDDLGVIARHFAGNRDPAPIERYLKKIVKNEAVDLPLRKILPKFSRANWNTFSETHGPNCFNGGLCMNEGAQYRKEFVDNDRLGPRLESEYTQITDGSRKASDLWVYVNKEKVPQHVATYVGEGMDPQGGKVSLLFTKNGISSSNPYVLQTSRMIGDEYKRFFNSILVYRPKPLRKLGCPQVFSKLLN